jgi:hypothetical protein
LNFRFTHSSGHDFASVSLSEANTRVSVILSEGERPSRRTPMLLRPDSPVRIPVMRRFACPVGIEIFPSRILPLNQRDLLRSFPALQLLFPAGGSECAVEFLTVYQTGAAVFF